MSNPRSMMNILEDEMDDVTAMRYKLSRMLVSKPERAKGWTNKNNMQTMRNRDKERTYKHCVNPLFLLNEYTRRTHAAHEDIVKEMIERYENGLELFGDEEKPADMEWMGKNSHVYLTENDVNIVLRTIMVGNPIESRRVA